MKFFDMLDEADFDKVLDRIEARVEVVIYKAFKEHGFRFPHSATSVSHNIMADQTEKESHQRRMIALQRLIDTARLASQSLFQLGQPGNNRDRERTNLDFAIAAVEKEFKQ